MTSVSPVAVLLSGQLEREEDKACDDMVITVLVSSEAYSGMLRKSYRFAAEQKNPLSGRL